MLQRNRNAKTINFLAWCLLVVALFGLATLALAEIRILGG